MGKKSRAKKERRQSHNIEQSEQLPVGGNESEPKPQGLESVLLWVIRLGVVAALFTPLVMYSKTYFPFVGPKGLYLMACSQIVFFAWVFLAIHYKKYRPNANKVLLIFSIFLIVLIFATLLGVDPSRSFWSKFERMTGLLMWLHLFGFFLAVSSSLKKLSEWNKIFAMSVAISIFVSFVSIVGEVGIAVYKKGGSSLGNTSFLGTYLLFNTFFATYLFFVEKKKWFKIFAAVAACMGFLGIYFAGARAATLSTIGGLVLIGLLYLALKTKKKSIRTTGRVALVLCFVVVFILLISFFTPGTLVSDKFIEITTASRAVNWNMAWKGFLEKPMFGWGPENYTVLFPKFFDPCLFTQKCGGEIWFDRTHNVVFDKLVATGIFGLLSYIGLFVVMGFVLLKKYYKEKTISFWLFAVFLSMLVSYFIQNLTVFDMPATLMLFVLTISFVAFLDDGKQHTETHQRQNKKPVRVWLTGLLGIIFLITFFEFVVQPLKTDIFVIDAITTQDPNVRLEYYKKTFEASSLGKYQIRDFFAQHSQGFVKENLEKVPREILIKELDFVSEQLIKTRKESPLDYRATLKLAQIYNVYALLDISKLALAEKYANEAMALSPTNQQSYWVLAQVKLYQKDNDMAIELVKAAIDLDVDWLASHKIAIQVLQRADKYDEAKELAKRAVSIHPEWAVEFEGILSTSSEE